MDDDARHTLTVSSTPDADVVRQLNAGLSDYNRAAAGFDDYMPLLVEARDRDGALLGGALCQTYWGWMYLETLWVREDLRGKGLGGELLQQAEQEALRRGCGGAWVDTFEFQALAFYQLHGYEVFAELPDYPPGHRRCFLKKRLGTP
jgi:GNAT superfamily N-acetyltransferase